MYIRTLPQLARGKENYDNKLDDTYSKDRNPKKTKRNDCMKSCARHSSEANQKYETKDEIPAQ